MNEPGYTVDPIDGLRVLRLAKQGIYAAFEGQGESPASAVSIAIVGYQNALDRIAELEAELREAKEEAAELASIAYMQAQADARGRWRELEAELAQLKEANRWRRHPEIPSDRNGTILVRSYSSGEASEPYVGTWADEEAEERDRASEWRPIAEVSDG